MSSKNYESVVNIIAPIYCNGVIIDFGYFAGVVINSLYDNCKS